VALDKREDLDKQMDRLIDCALTAPVEDFKTSSETDDSVEVEVCVAFFLTMFPANH
jgi:hypothetical protein